MNTLNINLNAGISVANAKAMAKQYLSNVVKDILEKEYGEDNVAMTRIGATSKSNILAAKVGVVKDVPDYKTAYVSDKDICVTVGITAKDFKLRKTTSRAYAAFNFDAAREEYREYKLDKESEVYVPKVIKKEDE